MLKLELNTFSIAARCARTGMLGVAVATKRPAVGSMVPWVQARAGAITTQARTNPYLGIWGLELLAEGYSARETLERILERDEGREWRQLGIVDAQGQSASFTGSKATPWAGGQTGPNYAVQGNILVGEEVVMCMVRAFLESETEPLCERLMQTLEAGQAAGGDRRGKQSAALYLTHIEDYPYLDLRVDDHPEPIQELRRILEIAKVDQLPTMADLPTKANPSGKLGEYIPPGIQHPKIQA